MRGHETIRKRARFSNGGQTASAPVRHRSQVQLPVVGEVSNRLAIGGAAALLAVLFLLSRGGGGSEQGIAIRDI
jgi:hypothetical protein